MAASGIAAGASAGSAFGPWGAAVGGVAGGLMDMGGGGGSAPAHASTAVYGSGLDGSGWNVNFSGIQSAGGNKATPTGLDQIGSISPLVIMAVVAVIGIAAWSKSKK